MDSGAVASTDSPIIFVSYVNLFRPLLHPHALVQRHFHTPNQRPAKIRASERFLCKARSQVSQFSSAHANLTAVPGQSQETAQMLAAVKDISDQGSVVAAVKARFNLDCVSAEYEGLLWRVHQQLAKMSARDFEGRKMDSMVKQLVKGTGVPKGKLLETTLGLQCLFVWRVARLQAQPKYGDLHSFLNAYPQVARESEHEQQSLYAFAELVALCVKYRPGKANKGWFMTFVPQMLEGRDAKYVTGSGQTHQTRLRVNIFEHESGVEPTPRPERRSSSPSGCLSKRKAGDAGVIDEPVGNRTRVDNNSTGFSFGGDDEASNWASVAWLGSLEGGLVAEDDLFSIASSDASDVISTIDALPEMTSLPLQPIMCFDEQSELLLVGDGEFSPLPVDQTLFGELPSSDVCAELDDYVECFSAFEANLNASDDLQPTDFSAQNEAPHGLSEAERALAAWFDSEIQPSLWA